MIRYAGILDTETNGLNPEVDRALEVAVVRYDLVHATPVQSFATLIKTTAGNSAQAINRIPANALLDACDPGEAWGVVEGMLRGCGVVLAHKAEFDYGFVPPRIQQAAPWVCTKSDIEWPRQDKPGASLVQLALAHDLGVAYAHRALTDCDLIARLLTRCRELGVDLQVLLARAMRPKALCLSLAPYEDRETVKAHGFEWFPELKQWRRRMFIEDVAKLPFKTKQLEEKKQ